MKAGLFNVREFGNELVDVYTEKVNAAFRSPVCHLAVRSYFSCLLAQGMKY